MLILIGADQNWSLLAYLENALGDASYRFGIKVPSPFYRDVDSVDRNRFWFAHDDHAKARTARAFDFGGEREEFQGHKARLCSSSLSLPKCRRVLHSPGVPEGIQAASDLQRRTPAQILIENLGVVTDPLNDTIGPILGEPHLLTGIVFASK